MSSETETKSIVNDELSRQNVKNQIAAILNIPNTESWEIFDSKKDQNLYLIHYTEKADLKIYGHLRGIVIDIESKEVVCRSYGHAPVAIADKLEVQNGIVTIEDQAGIIHQIPEGNIQIKKGFEGTLIRIFKHKNIIYFSTHKKISCIKSKWGNSITFMEMYTELVHINPEDFFFNDEPSCPIVQLFVLVHPDVQHVSKIDLSEGGFAIYLGGKLSREVPDESKYIPLLNIDIFSANKEEIISINEANEFLETGFYPGVKLSKDLRLNPGEFIMVYNSVDGEVRDIIKVQSTGYNWRSFVRNNNANICHQFYKLFNYLSPKALDDRFPKIPYFAENYIKKSLEKAPIIVWPSNQKAEDSRGIYRIWASLLLSVPLSKQVQVFNMMRDHQNDKKDLKDYIKSLLDYEDIDIKDISENIKNLVNDIRNTKYPLEQDIAEAMNIETNRRVDRMKGYNLYGLIRDMKCTFRMADEDKCE